MVHIRDLGLDFVVNVVGNIVEVVDLDGHAVELPFGRAVLHFHCLLVKGLEIGIPSEAPYLAYRAGDVPFGPAALAFVGLL